VRLQHHCSTVGSGAQTGGLVLRGLVALAVVTLLWLAWRGKPAAKLQPMPASPPRAAQAESTRSLPAAHPSGARSEPIGLVPVSARSSPAPLPAPADLGAAPSTANRTNRASTPAAPRPPFEEGVVAAQVALGRAGISPGSIDGVMGAQTRAALRVFQQKQGLPVTGALDEATQARLVLDGPIYTNYVVTPEDVASLQALGKTWLAKSQQDSLAYETILELVAERSHSSPKLVRWLNPQVDWENVPAGTILRIVNTDYPPVEQKAAFVRIALAERRLQAYDAKSNLLVHFPCSIAARVDKRPLGEELHIAATALNPNYTFDPAVFPESAEAQELGRKLILQPGPNNPVGTVWLSLDKAGYGIHGTPKPEEVGRTESHGCFRLANWNAEYLLKLVSVGTPVFVEP